MIRIHCFLTLFSFIHCSFCKIRITERKTCCLPSKQYLIAERLSRSLSAYPYAFPVAEIKVTRSEVTDAGTSCREERHTLIPSDPMGKAQQRFLGHSQISAFTVARSTTRDSFLSARTKNLTILISF